MKYQLPKLVLISLIFACIGITTEVVFTSLSKLINTVIAEDVIDWSLGGKSYLWMFLIYGAIPFLFKLGEAFVQKYNLFVQSLITVAAIYFIELTTGFALEMITGICPWKYTNGIHFFGYIRLDYFPFWLIFALLIVYVSQILNKRLA